MYWRLSLIFIFFPILELLGLWFFAWTPVGMLLLVVMIVATGIVGVFLVRRQGLRYWLEIQQRLDRGETPTLPIMHGALVFLAAVLLIVPGLLSTGLGFLLLFPPLRSLVISHMLLRFEMDRRRSGRRTAPGSPDVIDIP